MSIRTTALALALVLVACGDDTGGSASSGGGGGATTTASSDDSGAGATSSTSKTSGGGGDGGDGGAGGEVMGPAPSSSESSSASTGTGGEGPADGSCATPGLTLCESFEGAADGAFPDGWGARGDEWGEGVIGVASDDAVFGTKSLKVDGGNNGQHFMEIKTPLGALASHHYGRVFMKVAIPAPVAAQGTVLHADFIEGLGPGPNGGTHNVRWGTVGNDADMHQWIYNVQPSEADEFGEGTAYDYTWPGVWQCIEWYFDSPTQDGTLWIDGIELPIVLGAGHPAELPVFTSLGVGMANYQPAGDGFTVWFDELAYDDERIGCGE